MRVRAGFRKLTRNYQGIRTRGSRKKDESGSRLRQAERRAPSSGELLTTPSLKLVKSPRRARAGSTADGNVAAFPFITALSMTHHTNYFVVRDTWGVSGRSCPRSLGLVQRARIISKAFAASRSSGLSASALRSSVAPRSIWPSRQRVRPKSR